MAGDPLLSREGGVQIRTLPLETSPVYTHSCPLPRAPRGMRPGAPLPWSPPGRPLLARLGPTRPTCVSEAPSSCHPRTNSGLPFSARPGAWVSCLSLSGLVRHVHSGPQLPQL